MGHMDYNNMGPGGPSGKHPGGGEWNCPPGGFFMDGPQGQPGLKPGMGPQGNGRPGKGGGSIPSPATPLTPSSSCGGPPRYVGLIIMQIFLSWVVNLSFTG